METILECVMSCHMNSEGHSRFILFEIKHFYSLERIYNQSIIAGNITNDIHVPLYCLSIEFISATGNSAIKILPHNIKGSLSPIGYNTQSSSHESRIERELFSMMHWDAGECELPSFNLQNTGDLGYLTLPGNMAQTLNNSHQKHPFIFFTYLIPKTHFPS